MQISQVTKEDGIALAAILTILGKASFNGVTDADMERYSSAKKWLQQVAFSAAQQLKQPPASGSMRVTAMGALPTTGKKKMTVGKKRKK